VRLRNCRYQCIANTEDPEGREDSRNPDEPENPRYFEQDPRYHSRFTLPNPELLASDLEAMDFRSRPEIREARQRRGRVPAGSAMPTLRPRLAGERLDPVAPSIMEKEL
jgi:hypothetical protein